MPHIFLQLLAKARCEELTKENVGERKMSNQAGKRDSDRKEERWTKRFIKMRNICKQATITIPPLVYRKGSDPKEMESALLNLLKKHGLDESSTKSSITAAKEKLQMTRDLDGIDSGNIIDDGRRLRRKAFRCVVSVLMIPIYICIFKYLSFSIYRYIEDHSSSEEREQDSTEEEGNGNNSSSEQNFSEDEQEVVVSASRAKRVKTIDEWSEEE